MVQYPELPFEPPAEHGIVDPFGAIITIEQHHSHQVGISLVGTQVAPGMETPDLHGVEQPKVLEIDYMDVTIGKEEQLDQLIGYVKMS